VDEIFSSDLEDLLFPLVLYSLPQLRHLANFLSVDFLKYFQTLEILFFLLGVIESGDVCFSVSDSGVQTQLGLVSDASAKKKNNIILSYKIKILNQVKMLSSKTLYNTVSTSVRKIH